MKFIWEAGDIRPGRVVGKPDRGERWVIGWTIKSVVGCPSGNQYGLISHNGDGFVNLIGTKEDVAATLNAKGEWPSECLEKPH